MSGFGKVGAIDIRNKAEIQIALAVVAQSLVSHHGAQIRPPDAHVHNVANWISRVTLPRAAADAFGERGHLIQNGMDARHHILTVHKNRLSLGSAQRYMENSALLRHVDLLTAEHGIDPGTQTGLLHELQQ